MSVILSSGNLFDADTEALCCTVNCVGVMGVMGKGIALQFKKQYPKMYNGMFGYVDKCKAGEIKVGQVWVWQNTCEFDWQEFLTEPMYIICFPTKDHWKNPSKLEWISDGLDDLRQKIIDLKLVSIAIPPLGCGLGGLKWEVVKPLIEEKLKDLSTTILLYEPQ